MAQASKLSAMTSAPDIQDREFFRTQRLQELRELIQAVERPAGHEKFSFSLLLSGIPRGALIEVSGPGKTEIVAQFLAENAQLRLAWVENQLTIYPCALLQRKVRLDRLLFIEADSEIIWAVMQVLRSQLFNVVVVSLNHRLDETQLRRLQLESEKSHISIFLLTEKPHKAWPISMQLQIARTPDLVSKALNITILKERA